MKTNARRYKTLKYSRQLHYRFFPVVIIYSIKGTNNNIK